MISHSVPISVWVLIALCSAASLYATLVALVHPGWRTSTIRSRRNDVDTQERVHGSVSVLKPLCGAEPRLYENLATFCTQTHPSYQLLFGVASETDPAAREVRKLMRAYPQLAIELVVDATPHGRNRKVSNLINLAARARHDVFVIADSDIAVEPDYLMRVTAPLADANVGVVTCLYRGRRVGGFWARMGVLFIDKWFAPSVYLAKTLGVQAFGFGATIAVRRDVLLKSGGLEALRDCLADDYWLAERVRLLGLRTVLSDVVVTTDVIERGLPALWRRETRWLRTIRSVNRPGFASLCITITTPWLLASALLSFGFDSSGTDFTQATADTLVDLSTSFGLSARLLLHWRSARSARRFWRDLPLIPVRDALLLIEWCAACFGSSVLWRDARVPLRASRTTDDVCEQNSAAVASGSDAHDGR
ncbi:glycosyl transferase family protein [Caballeronia calidae]|uniref:Glycosyl transferase family protein n=1 Tax=Caballeronia calidae TaxID=1777139 RepID=A0A158BD80_9BURK|nr:bacteriohopanetetrol glucosamine biosynthesis glycosyltransferase HpnI [Caballeronia calidae]SAK68018.1 glycosyl transferase family protein [Caballeronia calidae]